MKTKDFGFWILGSSLLLAFSAGAQEGYSPSAEHAFYYVRALEIPKPRWTAYDARVFGVKMPKEVPMTTQDRAYTSPIWFTPSSP